MEKLKWACIGIGKHTELRGGVNAIAYAHAEALKRNADEFELVAGASLEQENLDAFAREFPSRGYLDINELLAKERLDGCTISTWAPAREEHVMAAINAGVKNILIEKPLALTIDAADRMKAAADAAGARLFVNFQRRYADIARAIRTGAPSRVDFDGGYATQKILLAMYESAEKGRLVEASQSMRKLIIYMRQ